MLGMKTFPSFSGFFLSFSKRIFPFPSEFVVFNIKRIIQEMKDEYKKISGHVSKQRLHFLSDLCHRRLKVYRLTGEKVYHRIISFSYIRHNETDYDYLLAANPDRITAREMVANKIVEIQFSWR